MVFHGVINSILLLNYKQKAWIQSVPIKVLLEANPLLWPCYAPDMPCFCKNEVMLNLISGTVKTTRSGQYYNNPIIYIMSNRCSLFV
jgi:hypothetical protein